LNAVFLYRMTWISSPIGPISGLSDMSLYCMAVIAKKLSLFVDFFYQVGLVEKPVSCLPINCFAKNWERQRGSTLLITIL